MINILEYVQTAGDRWSSKSNGPGCEFSVKRACQIIQCLTLQLLLYYVNTVHINLYKVRVKSFFTTGGHVGEWKCSAIHS